MRMNRWEHDVFLEIAPRLCWDCEDDCPGELSCVKLAEHIVEEKEAARDELETCQTIPEVAQKTRNQEDMQSKQL